MILDCNPNVLHEAEGEEPLSQRLCKERGRAWGEGQHGRKQQALLFQDPEGSRW